ncbi:LPS assembly lipoprotein LptE [Phaeovulum vinaykumarii]|uniref:LPS-assembly lipoprotein n=1 Tax=Phaeovulum vinaykumarii TaxID=407234 RepID=A0A1N7KQG0_9RHOB|nr:LPS assembly lipoprotein LptE [Phaeovulum vinaykumarii]SIS63781.1 LPS-assembly lipoprotein [Phaeovulum vinaykumarii]SOC01792.1 LPS-assembly lipoprotein [Phaeovulum vinaykumarii]
MWWSRRALIAAAGAAALAGCGFTPAYGPAGGAGALLGAVEPRAPETRDEFALSRRISERLGPAATPRYRLEYEIETDAEGQAITPENAITRYALSGISRYRLHDAASDAVLLTGEVRSFTSWKASGSTVATLTAEEDAHERLMRMLADQIVTRLIATAATLPRAAAVADAGAGAGR